MSRRQVLIGMFAAASAALFAPMARAQPDAGQARVQTWTMGQTAAACHLVGDRTRLRAALLADPSTGAFEDWAERRDRGCESRAALPGGDFHRYAVSEAFFRRDLKNNLLRDLAAVPPLPHARAPLKFDGRMSKKDRDEATALQTSAVRLSVLGECIVRADPANAHAVLSAKPASDAELSAFSGLMPSVERCVDPTRPTRMGLDDLRGAIALNYVRLARAPRTSGVSQ